MPHGPALGAPQLSEPLRRERWRILHAVPVGSDRPAISHLAIGPAGVFTLATRGFRAAHPKGPLERIEAHVMGDDLKVHGQSWPYLTEARAQAWRSAKHGPPGKAAGAAHRQMGKQRRRPDTGCESALPLPRIEFAAMDNQEFGQQGR